jgi:hypothetical protein
MMVKMAVILVACEALRLSPYHGVMTHQVTQLNKKPDAVLRVVSRRL